MKKFISKFYVALVFAFLYLPIFVLIVFSFNESKGTMWTGFSFKWYGELVRNELIMNSLLNGSGNYKVNFVTAILDGMVMRIGLSLLFGLALGMEHYGFWLGDALAGFTPFLIGVGFYFTDIWKKGACVEVPEEKE